MIYKFGSKRKGSESEEVLLTSPNCTHGSTKDANSTALGFSWKIDLGFGHGQILTGAESANPC